MGYDLNKTLTEQRFLNDLASDAVDAIRKLLGDSNPGAIVVPGPDGFLKLRISDKLAKVDVKVPKMAEQAMYMHIAYSILSTRNNVQEYHVQRFKRDRYAALRNAKIRLSNIKLDEIVQVMRNKAKWIKR